MKATVFMRILNPPSRCVEQLACHSLHLLRADLRDGEGTRDKTQDIGVMVEHRWLTWGSLEKIIVRPRDLRQAPSEKTAGTIPLARGDQSLDDLLREKIPPAIAPWQSGPHKIRPRCAVERK